QVDSDWVVNMSRQCAVLTHADWHTPTTFSLLIHHVIAGKTFITAVSEVLEWLEEHNDQLAELMRRGLKDAVQSPTTGPEVLAAAIRSVADALEHPVAPEHLYASAVTKAVNLGGNSTATALVAGQLIGGLLGNTASGTPSQLQNYLV